MQAIARRFAALPASFPSARSAALSRLNDRLVTALTGFLAQDRDHWVSVVCAAGFALLMGIDWLAA
jgi:hypothetical protein